MNKTNIALGLAVVAVVIAISALFVHSAQKAGGITNYDAIQTSKLTVGALGSGIGTVIQGTCTIVFPVATFSATTTINADCQSSSFAVGDVVLIGGFATSSTNLSTQAVIAGTGAASTTAGFAPTRITNLSGTTITPAGTGIGSSTQFILWRPLASTPGL